MDVLTLMATLGIDTSAYEQGLKNAGKSADDFASKAGKGLSDAGKSAEDLGSKASKAGKELSEAGKSAEDLGNKAGNGLSEAGKSVEDFASKVGKVMKSFAIGKALYDFGASAVNAYKDYEQLVGGVDTLFKSSSANVQEYAQTAYKTAGMSANEYMSTAINFSASLISSLGGDTAKAAEQTDKAISDMADNANKMGTSLEAVQNAYRGFARANFTMLDNLSLGYAGTKSGMEELLKDAEKLSGVKYDISSMSDMIDAIHVIQQNLGITGTTAKEAAETIEGSFNAVKASWQNVLTAIAGGGDLSEAINGLVDSLFGDGNTGLVHNLMTRVEEVIKGTAEFIGKAAPLFIKELPRLLVDIGAYLIKSLPSMIMNIVKAIPAAIGGLIDGIAGIFAPIDAATDHINESYQSIKSLIEAGLKGTVSLDADDGSNVFAKVNGILEELKTDAYKGSLTIDGNTDAADEALAGLQSAIDGLTGEGGSVAALQAAIVECEKLEINPELSDEQKQIVEGKLTELQEKLGELKAEPITLTVEGKAALDTANDIVGEIDKLGGKVTIDGDPEKGQAALDTIKNAIDSLLTGDGSIATLNEAITAVEDLEIDAILNDETDVAGQLAAIKQALIEASGQATITYSYGKAAGSDDAGWNAFKSFVDKQGWKSKDFTYSAHGKFTVDESTTEDIQAYAEAITSAATAIGDYESAVSNITSLAEQKLKSDIAQINQQATEELIELATLYNHGYMSRDEYLEAYGNVTNAAEAQIRERTEAYEVTAATAQTLNDGIKENDVPAAANMTADLVKDREVSADTIQNAMANLNEMRETGRAATKSDEISARTVLGYLTDLENGTKAMLEEAQSNYSAGIASANEQQAVADELQLTADAAGYLSDLAQRIAGNGEGWFDTVTQDGEKRDVEELQTKLNELITSYNGELSVIGQEQIGEDMASQLVDMLTNLLYGVEWVDGVSDEEAFEKAAADVAANAAEAAKGAQQQADALRQQAETALQQALEAAKNNNEMSSEELAGLLELIEAAGIELDEQTKQLIMSVEQTAEAAANQAASGGEEALQQSLETIQSMNEQVDAVAEHVAEVEQQINDLDTSSVGEALQEELDNADTTGLGENVQSELDNVDASGLTSEVGNGISEGGAQGAANVGQEMETEAAKAHDVWQNALNTLTLPSYFSIMGIGGGGGGGVDPAHAVKHATGMSGGDIVRGLTPFGMDENGNVHYAGEVGAEAVVGVNSLDRMIKESVNEALSNVLGRMDTLISGQNTGDVQIVLDTGTMVGAMTREINNSMGSLGKWRGGGRT